MKNYLRIKLLLLLLIADCGLLLSTSCSKKQPKNALISSYIDHRPGKKLPNKCATTINDK